MFWRWQLYLFVIRFIPTNDPRSSCLDFVTAKRKEVDGLIEQNVCTKINGSILSSGVNIIGGRFVLIMKKCVTSHKTMKAQCIAQCFSDTEKSFTVHEVAAMRPTLIRFILSISAVLSCACLHTICSRPSCNPENPSLQKYIYTSQSQG